MAEAGSLIRCSSCGEHPVVCDVWQEGAERQHLCGACFWCWAAALRRENAHGFWHVVHWDKAEQAAFARGEVPAGPEVAA